jgi:hypothetical protein
MKPREVEELMKHRELIIETRDSQNRDGKTLGAKILELQIKKASESVTSFKKDKKVIPASIRGKIFTQNLPKGKPATMMSQASDGEAILEDTAELGDLAGRLYRVDFIDTIKDVSYTDKDDKKRVFQIFSVTLMDPVTKGSIIWNSVGQENAKKARDWAS